MKIDVHVHLAGVGTQGSGCWLSPSFRRRPLFNLLRLWYGVSDQQMRSSVDQDWVDLIAGLVEESELDRAVALGFDGVYRADGSLDEKHSQLIVPPSWVFDACRRRPAALLPGPSVNPGRADAMERLDECVEGGAVLLKWLPAVQAIDPSQRRHTRFYEKMREAGIPLLVHSGGGEATFREVARELQDLRLLERPLEEGVKVICAHSAAPIIYSRDRNQITLLRTFLQRYSNLWVDNSGMANPSRFPYLSRFARDKGISERTLYGSDFPVPSSPVYYPRLGLRRLGKLQRTANPLQRDVAIKRALGYDDASLHRAADMLPNLHLWTERAARS
ncbi:MAG: amidohydrolase family protein [Gemmatimonadetes bacterium]|nr:amidohydrolase family protein [Gemmatimonadota bacterium]